MLKYTQYEAICIRKLLKTVLNILEILKQITLKEFKCSLFYLVLLRRLDF